MRTRLASLAVVGTVLAARPLLARTSETRNVDALARHLGCSTETARRLYRQARRDGYGAAYANVFRGRAIPGHEPMEVDSERRR